MSKTRLLHSQKRKRWKWIRERQSWRTRREKKSWRKKWNNKIKQNVAHTHSESQKTKKKQQRDEVRCEGQGEAETSPRKKTTKQDETKQSFMLYIKINVQNTEYGMQKQPSTNKPQTWLYNKMLACRLRVEFRCLFFLEIHMLIWWGLLHFHRLKIVASLSGTWKTNKKATEHPNNNNNTKNSDGNSNTKKCCRMNVYRRAKFPVQ